MSKSLREIYNEQRTLRDRMKGELSEWVRLCESIDRHHRKLNRVSRRMRLVLKQWEELQGELMYRIQTDDGAADWWKNGPPEDE